MCILQGHRRWPRRRPRPAPRRGAPPPSAATSWPSPCCRWPPPPSAGCSRSMHHDSFVSTTLPTRTQTLRICFLYHVLFYAAARPVLLYVYRGLGFSLVSCQPRWDYWSHAFMCSVTYKLPGFGLPRSLFLPFMPSMWLGTYVRTY